MQQCVDCQSHMRRKEDHMPDQKKGSSVSAPESAFTGLRRFNLIMGFLHLIQGVFMIVVSNATTYPIFTNDLISMWRPAL